MKNAIQKAIYGGYMHRWYMEDDNDPANSLSFREPEKMLLDPEFWRCLGVAMGDGKSKVIKSGGEPVDSISVNIVGGKIIERWRFRWHRFIDHLASGGSADEFFNDLLK